MKITITFLLILSTSVTYGQGRFDGPNFPIRYQQTTVGPKSKFYIVFSEDSVVRAKTGIETGTKPFSVTIKIDKKKQVVYPSDTKEIYRIRSGERLVGIPVDSCCWIFKSVQGKIIGYSYMDTLDDYDHVIAIQANETAPIVRLTIENLRMMIGETQDPVLQRMLKKEWKELALKHYNQN